MQKQSKKMNRWKSKAYVNIIATIDDIPTDIVNEPNNANDEMCYFVVAETTLKLVYDPKVK